MNIKNIQKNFIYLAIAFVIIRLFFNALLPVTDQSEGRYALIGYEMLAKGDFLTPMFHHKGGFVAFKGKPPLAFWSEATAMKCFGVNSFAAKLPSTMAALLLLWLMYFVVKRYKGISVARNATIFTGLSGLFFIYSGAVIVDMVLLFFIAGATIAYMAFLAEKNGKIKIFWSLLVFILAAGGMLTKGPIAIFEFGLPIFLWTFINNKWADLKSHSWSWILGPTLFFIIVVPWFYLSHKNDPEFLEYFFVNENFKRFISKDYGDKYGAGREFHYAAAIWMFMLAVLPWLLIPLICQLKKVKNNIFNKINKLSFIDPFEGVALLSFASITLFWSLTSRSPIHYILPTIPMFAIWLAIKCQQSFAEEKFAKKIQLSAWCLLTLLTIGLSIAAVFIKFSHSTTKYVLAEVNNLRNNEEKIKNSKVYFVRETPYSAYFYDHDNIISHKNESESHSMEINQNSSNILIIRQRYLVRDAVKPYLKNRIIKKVGNWNIVLPKSIVKK